MRTKKTSNEDPWHRWVAQGQLRPYQEFAQQLAVLQLPSAAIAELLIRAQGRYFRKIVERLAEEPDGISIEEEQLLLLTAFQEVRSCFTGSWKQSDEEFLTILGIRW